MRCIYDIIIFYLCNMNANELITFRTIRENTLKQYMRGGERLAEKIGVKKLSVDVIKDNYPKIIDILDNSSLHQKKAIINLLLLVVSPERGNPKDKLLYKELVNLLVIYDKEYQDERSMNKQNDKEKKNWTEWHDIIRIKNKLEEKYNENEEFDTLQDLIIICLYTLQRPRRLEYADCIIIDELDYIRLSLLEKEDEIFLVLGKKMYFSFGANKTKTQMDKNYQLITVKQSFVPLLKKYLEQNDSKYLLRKKNGDNLSHAGLRARLNKIFYPKLISASMLRKIYISGLPNDLSFAERQEIAIQMGHSVITSLKIYNKI